jgi:hypothetical protein
MRQTAGHQFLRPRLAAARITQVSDMQMGIAPESAEPTKVRIGQTYGISNARICQNQEIALGCLDPTLLP